MNKITLILLSLPFFFVVVFIHALWLKMAVQDIDKYYGLPVLLLILDLVIIVLGTVVDEIVDKR